MPRFRLRVSCQFDIDIDAKDESAAHITVSGIDVRADPRAVLALRCQSTVCRLVEREPEVVALSVSSPSEFARSLDP